MKDDFVITLRQEDLLDTDDIFNKEKIGSFSNYVMQENDFIFTTDIHTIPVFEYPLRLNAFFFFLCLDGSVELDINLKSYHLVKNMVAILEPKQLVFHHDHTENFKAVCCIISPNFMSDVATEFPTLWIQTPILNITEEWKNKFILFSDLLIRKMGNENNRYKKEILKCMFKICAYEILNLFESNFVLTSNAKAKSRKEEIVISFVNLVHQDFKIDRSVNYYADKLCVTSKHLSKTIKDLRGITASDYIDAYVILEAKAQLKSSCRTIQEISNDLNFANQSFFGKFFKHHTGMSPLQYRIKG